MKKLLSLFFMIGFLFSTSGCAYESKIIDDIDLVTAVGYDYVDEKHIRGTVSIPIFKPDQTITSETYSNTSSLIRENRSKLDAETNKPLLSGKLELALYNEELAKHGIFDYIDYLNRDPSVGSRVFLAVVKGDAKDYLEKKYKTQDTGIYIAGILEKNTERGSLPKTNLHQMLYTYYSKGADLFLPLLELKDDEVKISGMALFKGDKYVENISLKELFAFKTLIENYKFGIYPIQFGSRSADLENVKSKKEFKVDLTSSPPKIQIQIDIEGVVREFKGTKMNQKVVNQLEKKIEKELNKDYRRIIAKTQKHNIDTLGLGEIASSKNRFFDFKRFHDIYADIDIEAHAKVHITEYGVTQ